MQRSRHRRHDRVSATGVSDRACTTVRVNESEAMPKASRVDATYVEKPNFTSREWQTTLSATGIPVQLRSVSQGYGSGSTGASTRLIPGRPRRISPFASLWSQYLNIVRRRPPTASVTAERLSEICSTQGFPRTFVRHYCEVAAAGALIFEKCPRAAGWHSRLVVGPNSIRPD
jgi:hypothetical protein